jgi:hypothetical protein
MKKLVVLLLLAWTVLAWCGTTDKNTEFQPKIQSTVVVSGGVSVLTSTQAHINVATWVTISWNYFVIWSPKWNVNWSMILPYTFSWFTVTILQSWSKIEISDTVAQQNETIERLILPWWYSTEDYINTLVKTWSSCEVVEVEYEWATHTPWSMTYQIVPLQADPSEQDSWIAAYKWATTPDQCWDYTSHDWVNRFIITNPIQPSSIFVITTKPKTHIWLWQIEWPLTFRIQ